VAGETYEYTEMYPPMRERAEAAGHKASRMFGYAVEAEEVHARLYGMALEAVRRGEDLTGVDFFLCPICGYIEIGQAPEACPICKAKGDTFIRM